MKNPIFSIVVLSYNTANITKQCLEKFVNSAKELEKKRKEKVEIIVVENASTDNSLQMIKKNFPKIKLLVSMKNLGYGGGNNLGMRNSSGKYIILSNSDIFVSRNTLIDALDYVNKHQENDVIGCVLRLGTGEWQPSGGSLPTPSRTAFWWLGVTSLPWIGEFLPVVHPKKMSFFKKENNVEWLMGAFLVLKREVFLKTRGFDENFFMYMEEVEWFRRITNAGFKIHFADTFSVTHLDKASSGFNITKPLVAEAKGLIYFIKKYYDSESWWVKQTTVIGSLARYLIFLVLGNKSKRDAYAQIYKEAAFS